MVNSRGGGGEGALGYFFGWVCATQCVCGYVWDYKLAPRFKKKNLKLIARSRNGPIF